MHHNGHRGSGSRPKAGARLTPQQHAAALSLALEWRQQWRDEIAANGRGNGAPQTTVARPPGRPRTNTSDRAAFAAGIARAEFGRFYWDAKKHRVAGTKHKPRPPE